jgi:pyruvate kinase
MNTPDNLYHLSAGVIKDIESIRHALESLEEKMNLAVEKQKNRIEALHPLQKMSAENLVRYLVLRSKDVRSLQDQLHLSGLSSLASSESHVLSQVQAVLTITGKHFDESSLSACNYYTCSKLIQQRAKQLFGFKSDKDVPYIMVTFDTKFADNYQLVEELLEAGMNIARINCAHDNEEVWKKMIGLVEQATKKTGIPCKIYMDLAGPKIRGRILGAGRREGKIRLSKGQEIMLADCNSDYDPLKVIIGVDTPHVVEHLQTGSRVLFDDGIIEAEIISNDRGIAILRIIRASAKKNELKENKGINFPGTNLHLPALTDRDHSVLPFICQHADLVGYSFVHHPSDITELQKAIASEQKKPYIILKIETAEAVMNFPSLLIQGMKDEVFGVMIARGDLAVEIGFERLSEIQDELLWVSEAGHVPVIWATQVLETLNKSGIATRSEVTDASHSSMAECVMINKGDYVVDVTKTLKDILQRSGAHHVKKRYALRPMQMALSFFGE